MKWKLVARVGWIDVEYDNFDSIAELADFAEKVASGECENNIKVEIVPSERKDEVTEEADDNDNW